MKKESKESSGGLTKGSIGFAVASVFIVPPLMGFIGFMMAVVALSRGEDPLRCAIAMMLNLFLPFVGMILGVMVMLVMF